MPMSFLSVVKFRNADSIAAVSVLSSTTRKLLWASGGAVTCCVRDLLGEDVFAGRHGIVPGPGLGSTHADAREKQPCHRVLTSGISSSRGRAHIAARGLELGVSHLVSDHRKKLPILEVGRCCCGHTAPLPCGTFEVLGIEVE